MANDEAKYKRLGRYELRDEIGRGGMATVFRGYDLSLKREVAVKVLHPHLVSHEEARARFEREARSVARLHHPSIVEIYDYAEESSGEAFIVMELVEGYTLRDFLRERSQQPLVAEGAALIARQIFIALRIAHEAEIVHRDVKPENILLSRNGKIQLSDFGIASLAGIGQMTSTGQILGSPTYMSPEHIESPRVDARADIFSVGTILYEMAVGQMPFVGNNPHQIIKRVVEGYYDHPLSINPAVGHPLSSVIVKCLQQQPERRYQTAAEAVDELEAILTQMGIPDFEREQAEYLTHSAQWEENHLPEIVKRTLLIGKEAQRNKHLPEAMNHLNRVLAIEPGNETALGAVNVLSRRRKFRRNMERIGGLALISLVILGLIVGFVLYRINDDGLNSANDSEGPMSADSDSSSAVSQKNSQPPATGAEIPVPSRKVIIINNDTGNDTASDTDTLDSNGSPAPNSLVTTAQDSLETDSRDAGTGSDADRPKRNHPAAEPEKLRKIIFNPLPMSVDIAIDDARPFTFKATDRSRDLTVGTHRIQFTPADDRLEPLTQTIEVVESDQPMTVAARLRWKPGKLLIRCNIDAEVAVNGRSLGKTNQVMELDIRQGPTAPFRILLSARGYHPIEKLVSVSAGQTAELDVQLEKEDL